MEKYRTGYYLIFRIIATIIALLFTVWFILPIFRYGILNAFNGMGILLCGYVFVFYLKREKFHQIREKLYRKKFLRLLWKFLRFCLYSFGIYALVISIVMIAFSSLSPKENATEILLGAQVKGTSPTLTLYDRIMAGKEFMEQNPSVKCVASGGLGETATITEAQCMYNVLTQNGISSDRIYLENQATSTKENIRFSYEIIRQNHLNENIAIVSDRFHQTRARLIARKLGITSHIGCVNAETNWIYLPTFWVREWFGLPYDLFFR
ncbi:MAG: YdcF family protein [Clostridia bacterium]|nr:YdcF family protein [Clostridia bacterium]